MGFWKFYFGNTIIGGDYCFSVFSFESCVSSLLARLLGGWVWWPASWLTVSNSIDRFVKEDSLSRLVVCCSVGGAVAPGTFRPFGKCPRITRKRMENVKKRISKLRGLQQLTRLEPNASPAPTQTLSHQTRSRCMGVARVGPKRTDF